MSLLASPMNAARECRDGARSIRSGSELDPRYAAELEALADRLDEIRARMTADLDAAPRRRLPDWETEEDWGDPDYQRRPLVARGVIIGGDR